MKTDRMTQVEVEVDTLVIEERVDQKDLIVFNDDHNTFDYVIESLIKVCKHNVLQAEQCTTLIHYKGKCQVKRSDYETLEPMCTALLDRGISAEIQ